MKTEKIKLLRAIFSHLKLDEIPSNMVSRRLAIFKAFEENKDKLLEPEFSNKFWEVQGKVKATLSPTITAATIYSFINENQNLWEDAKKTEVPEELFQTEVSVELSENIKRIVERNQYQQDPPLQTDFLSKLLGKISTEKTRYPDFENEVKNYFRGAIGDLSWEEASKAYIWAVFKDSTESYRLFFEEFSRSAQAFEQLGLKFSYPEISGHVGHVSLIMNAVHAASEFSGGVFALRRMIRIANRIGEVGFTENEIKNFFKCYLDGSLDSVLLNPPSGLSYCKEVVKTYDYDFTVRLDHLVPIMECKPYELKVLIEKLVNLLMRVKIVIIGFTKSINIGEETTILDLISEIQQSALNTGTNGGILSLGEMFQQTNQNIIEKTVEYFSQKFTYDYLLRLRKGGISKILFDSFKMMSTTGATKTIGHQLIDIKNYYKVIYPDSWQSLFVYDFLLDVASKGLSSSSKQPVRERLKLLVQESPKHTQISQSLSSKKIEADVIFNALKSNVTYITPEFHTAEEAQDYFTEFLSYIKSILNKTWIKKILRTGYELYIETPVTQIWQNEMEDLSRELVGFYQNLVVTLSKDSSEINELIFESLREALIGLYYVDESLRDTEVVKIFLTLPEKPTIIDRESAEKYLDGAFQHSKIIINTILKREVEEEVERKTFDEEIGERISLDNTVIDWFIRASQFYNAIITEPISLEKTPDPNDVLLKTIYGGVIFLTEESMKSLLLDQDEKIRKATFLRELIQFEVIKNTFSELKFDYNVQSIINFILEQIELWNRVFSLRGILTNLEADNRIKKATKLNEEHTLIEEPGIRGIFARELIQDWIRTWANSAIKLSESYLNDVLPSVGEEEREEFEQDVLEKIFNATGRNDIRNFMVPLIIGNLKQPMGFESSALASEFMDYSHDVFPEAVSCDSQLTMFFLCNNWLGVIQELMLYRREVTGALDFIIYQGNKVESCRQILGAPQEFNISDVVKKATGLSLSGLTLQTVVFQLGEKEIFSAVSYTENPFEGSVVTGLTLELISKENIPLEIIHPLTQNASETIAGLMERNSSNATNPDSLFKAVVQQLLEEARLILLKDSGTLKERLPSEIDPEDSLLTRNISRSNLKITTAYKLQLKHIEKGTILPEVVEFYGEKLDHFNLFVQLIIPFFEPGKIIKERLMTDYQLMNYLGVSREENLQVFPSLVVFDDNETYKVVFGTFTPPNILYIIIAEENVESKMGLRTIQYLLKTREFEEFVKDSGLLSLPELNRSIPLNTIRVLREKEGVTVINFELIKNISLGAI